MKTIARLVFVLIYILAVITSILIVIKPGAAFFYYKTTLQMDRCRLEDGFAYRCPVNLSPIIFPPSRVLLFENGQQLYADTRHQVGEVGDGCFAAKVTEGGDYVIYFAPIGNSNPLTGAKSYRAYFAYAFLSRTMGILYLSFLLPGLLGFFRFAFGQVKAWKSPRRLPQEVLQLVTRHLAQKGALTAGIQQSASSEWGSFLLKWGKLYVTAIMAGYGLVFIEWIFQVTGISYMDVLELGEKLEVFLLSALFLSGLVLVLLVTLLTLALILRLVRLAWVALLIAELAPTALLVTLIVLMVDNFTYVVFSFGILTATGLLRITYGVLIGTLFVSLYWRRLKSSALDIGNKQFTRDFHWLSGTTMGLIGFSLAAALLNFAPSSPTTATAGQPEASVLSRPNIILIGSDGLSAKNMSIYGYERDTTPNIQQLGNVSLVAENVFANSSSTLGSIASIFTSKLPTQVGVIYPPDILQGADAYEHLPGILSAAGYTTIEIGVPYYVDAYEMNILDGFDVVNQRSIQKDPLVRVWREVGYDSSAYFIYRLEEKLIDRFLQVFYLDTITNPFSVVTQSNAWRRGRTQVDQLLTVLDQSKEPVFVHVHLMGTHGPRFAETKSVYSQGQEQSGNWMIDFYDDSILAFDGYIGEIIEYLKVNGQYEHTILIIYSDHPMGWNIRERIPLILHFPGDQYTGTITYNTQHLDIAPTILDYLGQSVPDWMTGRSLLAANPGTDDLIFCVGGEDTVWDENDLWTRGANQLQPPFYQFTIIQAVACDQWYELNLRTQDWYSGIVDQSTAACNGSDLPSKADVMQSIRALLAIQGYDISSLR